VYLFWIALLSLLPSLSRADTILILGDSISAGYGVALETSWVARLQARLPDSRIINASISGETSDGGRARLPALLAQYHPDFVIIELGGNDGLRGFSIEHIRDNLITMVELCRKRGTSVLLLGMRIPPNYGPRYTRMFQGVFTDVARQFDVPVVPFFLEGIATDARLMQADGIHPNDRAQGRLLETVWPVLRPLLTSTQSFGDKEAP